MFPYIVSGQVGSLGSEFWTSFMLTDGMESQKDEMTNTGRTGTRARFPDSLIKFHSTVDYPLVAISVTQIYGIHPLLTQLPTLLLPFATSLFSLDLSVLATAYIQSTPVTPSLL